MKISVCIFLILILISFVYANYGCSDGSEILTDLKNIEVGEIGRPYGLSILVVKTSDPSRSVDIFIDSKAMILKTNLSVELEKDDYDITLINLAEDSAEIKIEGSTKEIEFESIEKIGELYVYIQSASGTYPEGEAEINLFVGVDHVSLDYVEPIEQKKIEDVEYVIEFLSSLDQKAFLRLLKCENSTILEIENLEEQNQSNEEAGENGSINGEGSEEQNKSNEEYFGEIYIGNKRVTLEKGEGINRLISGENKVDTSLEIQIDNKEVFIKIGENYQKISVSVEDAIFNVSRIKKINNIEIKEREGEVFYNLKGENRAYIFFIIPITAEIEQEISVVDGSEIKLKRPWWHFLAFGV